MNNRNMFPPPPPPPPPSTSSSSSQGGGGGLMRYGSAPSSVISTAVESVCNRRQFSSSEGFAPETCAIANLQSSDDHQGGLNITTSSSSLVRHSSMPAGFLNHLPPADTGFCMTRGMNIGSRYDSKSESSVSRLNSQLSFTRPKEVLSWISEEDDNTYNANKTSSHPNATASFTMESQFQFGMAQTALELTTMDNLLNIPHDSVPCKIRAKRGFATHPRSIAERERRTRISGKLKKLQDLVPNMDKQTSYADMLDLAVQHIKTLQNQVHKLNNELDSCTCGCKKTIAS